MIGYTSRLSRDLKRWRERGILDAETARVIEADVAAHSISASIPSAMAILGAVLLCFAAMTFVAANWDTLSKLTRLIILFGALWGAYGAAWFLQRTSHPYLVQAAILLGSGLFGANIMLIAQIYHLDGNPPDAVLMWACGVLLGGAVLQSRPALALAIILCSLWSWWEVIQSPTAVHFPFLLAWFACAVAVAWHRWASGYHLLAIALAAWIVGIGYLFEPGDVFGMKSANPVVVGIGLAIMAGGWVAHERVNWITDGFGDHLPLYGVMIAFAGLFGLQFIDKIPVGWMAVLALLALCVVVAGLYAGIQGENRSLARLAYTLFCIELLGLYFKTLGTLLDTALFFLIAGVIVIVMAIVAAKLNKSVSAGTGPVS
jgi:uncharacterized membrane protein